MACWLLGSIGEEGIEASSAEYLTEVGTALHCSISIPPIVVRSLALEQLEQEYGLAYLTALEFLLRSIALLQSPSANLTSPHERFVVL